MRRELNLQEIIDAGRAYETYATWERACAFAHALYGESATRLTYSQTAFPESDHRLRTMQALAFDAAGQLLPFDIGASWWVGRDLPDEMRADAADLVRMDLARGLGGGLPDALRDELRAFAEELLGIETLHTWLEWSESETFTWTFDLTTPPPQPSGTIVDDAGASLTRTDIVAAGQEGERYIRWEGAREYVHTLYGERAVKAEVISFSRYNDFTYDRDIRLDVFDATGTRLFYDLRLPWWERFGHSEDDIAKYAEEHNPKEEVDSEYEPAYGSMMGRQEEAEIERLATTLLGADFIATRNSWGADTTTYDLTQPPALRYPRLWLYHGDE